MNVDNVTAEIIAPVKAFALAAPLLWAPMGFDPYDLYIGRDQWYASCTVELEFTPKPITGGGTGSFSKATLDNFYSYARALRNQGFDELKVSMDPPKSFWDMTGYWQRGYYPPTLIPYTNLNRIRIKLNYNRSLSVSNNTKSSIELRGGRVHEV